MSTYIGIDISKDTLVVAYPLENDKFKTATFNNNPLGCKKLINSLPVDSHCIAEATGSYSLLLCYCLAEASIKVSLLNP